MNDQLHVYEALVDELAAAGVEATFGLMGEDTAALITDLGRRDVAYYYARHENVAIAMADGYAWATGRLGVAIISRGPGLTNGLTAATNAAKSGRPLLIVTAESSPGLVSDLKVIDQRAMLEAVGVTYVRAGVAAEVVEMFRKARGAAEMGAATVLAVPHDVLHSVIDVGVDPPSPSSPPPNARAQPDRAEVEAAVAMLRSCRRPLILVGRGGAEQREIYERLAQRTGALLGTTFLAKGLFASSPLDVGVVGGFSDYSARPVLREVDCVLAFGASLNGFTRGHGTILPKARIIQFDTDPSAFGRYGPVELAVRGDAITAARHLLESVPQVGTERHELHLPELLETLAQRDIFGPVDDSDESGIDPRVCAAILDAHLPAERLVVSDGGHHLGFGSTAMRVDATGRIRLTTDFAAIGLGLGTALGAAAGRPDSTTVLFIGDGGLAMTMGDLATLAHYRSPVVVVVMNDRAYGAERHFLDLENLPHHRSLLDEIDFAAVADGLGIEGITIRRTDDFRDHAERLSRPGGPLLVDCKINPAVRAQWLVDLDAARRKSTSTAAT